MTGDINIGFITVAEEEGESREFARPREIYDRRVIKPPAPPSLTGHRVVGRPNNELTPEYTLQ